MSWLFMILIDTRVDYHREGANVYSIGVWSLEDII